jgi:hypothetical protein
MPDLPEAFICLTTKLFLFSCLKYIWSFIRTLLLLSIKARVPTVMTSLLLHIHRYVAVKHLPLAITIIIIMINYDILSLFSDYYCYRRNDSCLERELHCRERGSESGRFAWYEAMYKCYQY